MTPHLRSATPADLAAINAIYNYYVRSSTATYQASPEPEEARLAWFTGRDASRHPVRVVEIDRHIAAWGSLSPFGKR